MPAFQARATHTCCLQAYKYYAHKLLTRVNTITGVTYKDDPTFFALELANEPRCTDGYEASIGIKPGTIIGAWVAEMAAYIRSLDPNHMVSHLKQEVNLRYDNVQILACKSVLLMPLWQVFAIRMLPQGPF